MPFRRLSRVFLLISLFLTACQGTSVSFAPQMVSVRPAATRTPFQPETPLPTARTSGLWIDPAVPELLRAALDGRGFAQAASAQDADLRLEFSAGAGRPGLSTWIYALVAAFPTVRDGVTLDELRQAWSGNGPGLVMTGSTRAAMRHVFGSDPGGGVRVLPAAEIKPALWQQPGLWGLLPFEDLEPELKVLEIDGRSPIRKDFDPAGYPLVAAFTLQPASVQLPASNRDPSKLVTVMMTGTTALVRAISFKMQQNGIEYPARDILDWLRGADILHVSNEVAFTPDCPPPDPNDGRLRFCSAETDIGLLDAVGVDVVELSGNHVNDWGTEALSHTLDLYRQRGWPFFAGGADLESARQPAILERGGVRFAFIGCNSPGPDFAWATASSPGAAPCADYGWLVDAIRQLKAAGDVVIVALQDYEYYTPEPRPEQIETFRRLAEAGADIVSGSQAHYSQAMEFHNGAFIHYGLGNLFFDQMSHTYDDGTRTTDIRREFLDRHVFYNGRHISTELLTAMLEDYSKPRPMTPDERQAFLQEYFTASGWRP